MRFSPEQIAEIRAAVIDMAIAGDEATDRASELHADRVVFWLENRDALQNGDI